MISKIKNETTFQVVKSLRQHRGKLHQFLSYQFFGRCTYIFMYMFYVHVSVALSVFFCM